MKDLHLNDATRSTNIQHLASKLVCEVGDGLQVFVLVSEGLTGSQLARVEVLGRFLKCSLKLAALYLAVAHLAVVGQQFLKELGSKNVDLGEEQLTLDQSSIAVVQDSPDRHQIFQLTSGLLDNAVLTSQDNGHAGQVFHLGVAHDQRVNVEASSGENTRKTRQHTRLVLDQTVEDVALRGRHGRRGHLIQNVGDGGLG